MNFTEQDHLMMKRAIALAAVAEAKGEVPVGAVLVQDDTIIGEGFNQSILQNDPTAHAEIIALREAGNLLQNYRLPGTKLYITLEPCLMCAGAIVHARVDELIFGANDPKTGVAESQMRFFELPFLNHHVAVRSGLLKDEASNQLKAFFKRRRKYCNSQDSDLVEHRHFTEGRNPEN